MLGVGGCGLTREGFCGCVYFFCGSRCCKNSVFECGELTLPNTAVTKSVHTFASAHGQDAVNEKCVAMLLTSTLLLMSNKIYAKDTSKLGVVS